MPCHCEAHLTSHTGSQISATSREVDAHLTAQDSIWDGEAGCFKSSCGVSSAAVPQPEAHPAGLLCANDVCCCSRGPHGISHLHSTKAKSQSRVFVSTN